MGCENLDYSKKINTFFPYFKLKINKYIREWFKYCLVKFPLQLNFYRRAKTAKKGMIVFRFEFCVYKGFQ